MSSFVFYQCQPPLERRFVPSGWIRMPLEMRMNTFLITALQTPDRDSFCFSWMNDCGHAENVRDFEHKPPSWRTKCSICFADTGKRRWISHPLHRLEHLSLWEHGYLIVYQDGFIQPWKKGHSSVSFLRMLARVQRKVSFQRHCRVIPAIGQLFT